MILYLDTSALVKKFIDEPFSDLVIHHCRMAEAARKEGLTVISS
jgi:hypothetical protein